MSQYSVTVYVDAKGIGHAFVALKGPDGVVAAGFYPDAPGKPADYPTDSSGNVLGSGGVLRDDTVTGGSPENPEPHSYDYAQTYEITPSQYEAMYAVIASIARNESDAYIVTENQCTEVARDILRAGGVPHPLGEGPWPHSLIPSTDGFVKDGGQWYQIELSSDSASGTQYVPVSPEKAAELDAIERGDYASEALTTADPLNQLLEGKESRAPLPDGLKGLPLGFEPDATDDSTWGGGLDDAPGRNEVYGAIDAPPVGAGGADFVTDIQDLVNRIPTDDSGGDFLGGTDFSVEQVTGSATSPATPTGTAGVPGTADTATAPKHYSTSDAQDVFLEIYGAGMDTFAEIMKYATNNNPIVAGKFTIIEVSEELIRVAIASSSNDPYKLGEATFAAMGSIIGGVIGGIGGAALTPYFPPAGGSVGSIVISKLGEGIGKEAWDALVNGATTSAPEADIVFAGDFLSNVTQKDAYGDAIPPSPTETSQQIDAAFGSWTAGYEPDIEDDSTWGGGLLDDAPSRNEVYGQASTPAATANLSDNLSQEIQDAADQIDTDGTGKDLFDDEGLFSPEQVTNQSAQSSGYAPGDPYDRQPMFTNPDPNGLKHNITGKIDYTLSPIGTGGVVTGGSLFGAATGGDSANPASTVTPTRDPDADLNETNLEVGSGDTLAAIAQANGVSLKELLDANPQITHPDLIHPGQIVNVPDKTSGGEGSSGDGTSTGFGGGEGSSDNSVFTGESFQVAADGSVMRDISAGLLPDAAPADLQFSQNTVNGLSSATSFYSALERGDEVGAAIAGAKIANNIAIASGGEGFLGTTGVAGLGAFSGALGLYQSFKQGDAVGVAVNAVSFTAGVEALAQSAGASLGAVGVAAAEFVPYIGMVYGIAKGDPYATIGAALMSTGNPYLMVAGLIIQVLGSILGKKDKGPPTGEGQITVNPDGSLAAIATGKRGGDDIVRNALNDLITRAGNEGIALNPALLPALRYNGSYYVLTYQNEGYQRAIASKDLVNLLLERARPQMWTTLGVEGGTLYRQGDGSVVFMAEASAVKDLGIITGGGNVKGSPEVVLVQKGDAASSGAPSPGQVVATTRYLNEPAPLFSGRTGDLGALALGFGAAGFSLATGVTSGGLAGQGGGGGAGGGGGGNVAYIHSADSLSALSEPAPLAVARLSESALISSTGASFGDEASDIYRPSGIATLLDSNSPTTPIFVPDAVRVLSVAQPLTAPTLVEPMHDVGDDNLLMGAFSPAAMSMDISEGTSDSDTSVALEAAAPNNPPLAAGEHFTGTEDTALQWTVGQLLANDADPEGDTLTLTGVGGANHGVVSLAAGVVSFTPQANYFGEASFDYTVTDAQGASATATVTLALAPVNDAPLVSGEVLASDEDTIDLIAQAALLANDTDVEGEALAIISVTNSQHGAVSLEADGSIRFTPDANFHGQASFDYTVADTSGGESVATALLELAAVNDVPMVAGETLASSEDTETLIPQALLLANDTDADSATDGDVLSIVSVGTATHGAVSLDAGVVHFTPEINYFGTASFDYTVSDGHGGEATTTATLAINPVNDAPLALGETLAATEDTVTLTPQALLLANDTDVEGETLSITAVANGQHGSVSLDADGTLRFTPEANFHGQASFDYTVADTSGGESTATALLDIAAVNDVPVATGERMALDEDATAVIAASLLLANDTDADSATDGDSLAINSVTGARHGSVSLLADGSVQFVPEANFFGEAAFDYTVNDAMGATATTTSYLDIAAVNDAPLVTDDYFVTDRDTVNFIAPATLLANDTDVEGDALSISAVGNAQHSSVSVEADGTLRFTPEAGYTGEATFDYTVSDGGDSAGARVHLDVQANSAPLATPETIAGSEDALLLIDPAALLANDTDSNGDTLSITQVSNPAHGSVAIGAGGVIQFQPAANYSGAAGFDYTISDGRGGVAGTTATIDVQPVNDNPYASAESVTVYEDATADIAAGLLLANDSDVDGDSLSIGAVWGANNGWVSLSGGTVYYTPAPDYSGADQFSYSVSDGRGGSATTTAYLDVRNLNDQPDVYVPGGGVFFTGVSGSVYTGLIASEDPDGPNDRQTHAIAYAPAVGSASVDYQGTLVDWSYNSGGSGDGSIAFTVRITDDDGAYLDVDIFPIGQWWRVGGYGGYLGVTPVVLDLDGDGVELVALPDSSARFDVNGDGAREAIAWVAADDGLLVYDHNSDRIIERLDEISFTGYLPGARTDLEGLAAFDTNHDGALSARDAEWSDFGVWQDKNQDGRTDAGEFRALAEADIAQIALASDHRLETRDGNVIFGTSSYTRTDGTDAEVADVRLRYEETAAPGSDPTPDDRTDDDGSIPLAPAADPPTTGASPVTADAGPANTGPATAGTPNAAEHPPAPASGAAQPTTDATVPVSPAASSAESAGAAPAEVPLTTDPTPVRAAADPLLVQAEIDRLVTQLYSDMAAFDPKPPAEISLPIPPQSFDSMLTSDTYRDQTYLQGVG